MAVGDNINDGYIPKVGDITDASDRPKSDDSGTYIGRTGVSSGTPISSGRTETAREEIASQLESTRELFLNWAITSYESRPIHRYLSERAQQKIETESKEFTITLPNYTLLYCSTYIIVFFT